MIITLNKIKSLQLWGKLGGFIAEIIFIMSLLAIGVVMIKYAGLGNGSFIVLGWLVALFAQNLKITFNKGDE